MHEIRIIANFLGSAADVFRTAIDTPYLTVRAKEIITRLFNQLKDCDSINNLRRLVIDFIKEAFMIYEKLPLDDQEQHYDLLEIKESEIKRILEKINDFEILYNTIEAVLEDLLEEVGSE